MDQTNKPINELRNRMAVPLASMTSFVVILEMCVIVQISSTVEGENGTECLPLHHRYLQKNSRKEQF